MEIPTAVLAVLFLMGTLCSQTCPAYHECFSFMCPHSLAMAGSTLTRCLRPSKERAPEGSQGLLFGANTLTACCFLYISWQIPCKFVNDYYETSSQCYKPGIIFQTKRGHQVCADPNETWVQEYISELEVNA